MKEKIDIKNIKWLAPEYNHIEKSNDWLWAIGLIALILAIISFWRGNALFGIFILLAGTVLIMFSVRKPQEVEFEINDKEIKVGDKMYFYQKITGFTIEEDEPYNKLIIETTRNFIPVQIIPVPIDISPQIKEELLKIITEKNLKEPRAVQFMEKLGF
ncbi:MAG: hypothetical protein U9R00_02745 [Patescibacteria group bacterium]|nr:hypothetical protein [Patescibacteria group bacterium]